MIRHRRIPVIQRLSAGFITKWWRRYAEDRFCGAPCARITVIR
jgi:hypothetical protein